MQAGTRLFHDFDMESDDTDADELDVLAPVTEYVALALVVVSEEQVSVIEYTTPGPDVGNFLLKIPLWRFLPHKSVVLLLPVGVRSAHTQASPSGNISLRNIF